VVDEALWGIDLFRRLQKPNGGIPGGIESAAHPKSGEASWQESLQVMAYAPDIWSSYWYASAAARAGVVLRSLDASLAKEYEESALKAFAFAEQEYSSPPEDGWSPKISDLRNFAALELWRLTGDDRWHQLFLDTTVFTEPDRSTSRDKKYRQGAAAFLYARLDRQEVEPDVQANARQAVVNQANNVAAMTEETGYQWSKHHPHAPVGYGTGWASPSEAQMILHAHYLEQDNRYLEAALRSTQAPLGANQDNLVYTTGLGMRSPRNPLIIDQRIMGVDPPPGISVYGPLDLQHRGYKDYWFVKYFMNDQMYPEPVKWPSTELHVDVYLNVAMSEFTVQQTIGPAAYVWAYLAARE
jgi:endoglucanase